MNGIEEPRAVMQGLFRQYLSSLPMWHRLEGPLTDLCTRLPLTAGPEQRHNFIKVLLDIKQHLLAEDVPRANITWLEDQLEQYNSVRQLSTHKEEETMVERAVIDSYIRNPTTTEGVVSTTQPLNYSQLARVTREIFDKKGQVKFFISRDTVLKGNIVAAHFDAPQIVSVARVLVSRKVDELTGKPILTIVGLFGQKIDESKYLVQREITEKFYVYKFITDDNEEYVLMSLHQLVMGEYVVTGVTTRIDDRKELSRTAKLPTKQLYMFANECVERIITFENDASFFEHLDKMNATKETLYDLPFVIEPRRKKESDPVKRYVTLQPAWFKAFIWAWLLHSPQNILQPYPLHVIIIGPKGTGKTTLFEAICSLSKEHSGLFRGDGSTLKGLVPSFSESQPKLGYLASCSRFSFVDEFFRCASRNRANNAVASEQDEGYAMMNDLLEHRKGTYSSGKGNVTTVMRSRMIAATNPVDAQGRIKNVEELLSRISPSMLNRCLIYWQKEGDEHSSFIRHANERELKRLDYAVSSSDWLSIVDFCQGKNCEWDGTKVRDIYEGTKGVLSKTLLEHYDSRHKHHLDCIMDGVIKTRCIFERDTTFTANDEDYALAGKIWRTIITGWLDPEAIRALPLRDRISFLPDDAEWLYRTICKHDGPYDRQSLEDDGTKELGKSRFREMFILLEDHGLVMTHDGNIVPHYIAERKGLR